MFRKVIAGVLAISICASISSLDLNAANCEETTSEETTGTTLEETTEFCGDGEVHEDEYDDLTWSITGTVLTISGTGAMYDYHRPYDVPWYDYRSYITEVIIKEGVGSIGRYAFNGCTSLTKITVPSTITAIGEQAFDSCSLLESVYIPEGVTEIGDNAFYSCTSITEFNIPSTVKLIDSQAFHKCTSLKAVTFAENSVLETINSYAFKNCNSLEELVIPDSVTYLGSSITDQCLSLKKITLGSGITDLANYGFINNTALETVICRGEIKTIGSSCFSNCFSLENVVINNVVEEVKDKAFYYCIEYKEMTFEATTIADNAFEKSGINNIGENADIVFSVGNVYVTPDYAGKNVTVPIKIKGNKSFGRARIELMYSDKLEYVDTKIDVMGWVYMERTVSTQTIVLGECYKTDDGTLVNMTFKLPEDTETGDTFTVNITGFTLEDSTDTSYDGYGTVSGKITIAESIEDGDVNDDQNVNTADIVALQRFILKSSTAADANTSDMNDDGVVNVIDLALLKEKIISNS